MSGPSLSTHVLDTSSGKPAAGVTVSLARLEGDRAVAVSEARTDADGRVPNLARDLTPGSYRLSFEVGAYFRAQGHGSLFGRVTLELDVAADGRHYHLPLLVSPFACVAYRGS